MIDVVLDLQFGDVGKGRIVDHLAGDYEVVARFNGGANSGHVIKYNGKEIALHLIPSGIFYGKICVIGNGVVIDPVALKNEIEMLEKEEIEVRKNLIISTNAHIVTPNHIQFEIDDYNSNKIGTTKRGIGPCVCDKVDRIGLRVCDINKEFIDTIEKYQWDEKFKKSLEFLLTLQIAKLSNYLNDPSIKILAEGAQGTLLDIDHGTYPYVTSSNTTIGSVMTGLGVSHKNIRKVFGLFKAYMTRVGNGPFITELDDETGEKMRKIGHEFGATTGRPRRCGWLDIPALRYACMINGITDLVMTKSDILNDFDEVKVCIGYSYFDKDYQEDFDFFDYSMISDQEVKPIYKIFKGWNTLNNKEPLEEYIRYIESEVGVPITLVSAGKDRNDIYGRIKM